MAIMEQVGINLGTLPTKKDLVITHADFSIAGLIGRFPRQFNKAILTQNAEEAISIFGGHEISSYYGWDGITGYYQNLRGTTGSLYVASYVGNAAGTIDAVTATADLNSQEAAPNPTLQIDDAYLEELGYGAWGNRTGYTITNGNRFDTLASIAGLPADTSIYVDSVIGIKVGDIIKVIATGGGGATVYKKVIAIVESTGQVSFSGAFHATANVEADDVISVIGFRLRLYRKSSTGIITEVESTKGAVYCTMEPEVTDYYIQNVFSDSMFIKATDRSVVATAIEEAFPVDVSTVTYMGSGNDGTAPATSVSWVNSLNLFDDLPIRMLCNMEDTTTATNKAGELYCNSREDDPKWMYTLQSDQSKSQLVSIGNGYQRSDDVVGIVVANWLAITDPFTNSPTAPYRNVPNPGHMMGLWIRSINTLGIHFVPSVSAIPIVGIEGIVGDQFLDKIDRRDLVNAGINVIQNITGSGYVVKNWVTPSTTDEFQWGNGILMRSFVQVSIGDSVQDSENEPNSFNRIQAVAGAVQEFYYILWAQGSTGNVAEGETFGILQNEDGTFTTFKDHVYVQADAFNNPASEIRIGKRRIDSWFSSPSPAVDIRINVGFIF